MQKVFKGEEWAWLRCADIKRTKEYVPWPRGGGGEDVWTTMIVLECLCGKKIQMEDSKFPNKRRMSDCGCGGSKDEQRKMVKTVVLPVSFINAIEKYSNVNLKGNFSRALVKLTRPALTAEMAKIDKMEKVVDSEIA